MPAVLSGVRSVATWLLVVGGCDRLFELRPVETPPGDSSTEHLDDGDLDDGELDAPDANPVDVDGDGIDNLVDNCPLVANPSQRDEDADGYGDRCDNCIGFPNAGQVDDDLDGVGNGCDPEGGATTLLYRYGVDGADSLTDWIPRGGIWQLTSEAIRSFDATDGNLMLARPVPVATITVEIGFHVLAHQAAAGVTVWVQADESSPPFDGNHCGPRVGPVGFEILTRSVGTDTASIGVEPTAQAFELDPFRMWARNPGSRYITCGERGYPTNVPFQAASNVPRKLGLHTYQVDVDIEYVLVYAGP